MPSSSASSQPGSESGAVPGTARVVAVGASGYRQLPPEARLTPFEVRVIEIFVNAASLLNVPKSVATIYGLLFASAQPLTFSQIEQKLDLSKGSVSQGLRTLRDFGAVHSLPSLDGSRERFSPELELKKLVRAMLEDRLQPLLQSGRVGTEGLETLIEEKDNLDLRAVLLDRIRRLKAWRRKGSGIAPLLSQFLN